MALSKLRNAFALLPPNVRVATIIFTVALLWLVSGAFSNDAAKPSQSELQASTEVRGNNIFTVRARHFNAQTVPEIVALRGRTEANRDVSLRAELSGRIDSVLVERGQQVSSGDVICELAPEDRPLRLKEAEASLKQAELEYQGAKRLKRGGYQSDTAIASAKANLERAEAELERRKLDVANLAVRAPFGGVIDELPVDKGDWLQRGDVCARILELSPLLVSAQASEAQVLKLQAGQPARVTLTQGQTADGIVSFVGQGADPVTRTFTVEITLENTQQWRSGLSSQLYVPVAEQRGHLISPALLALDDEGKPGVRTLNTDKRVEWHSVALLSDSGEGVWVAGLQEEVDIITVGQEYVSVGQQVAVDWESKGTSETSSIVSNEAESNISAEPDLPEDGIVASIAESNTNANAKATGDQGSDSH